MLLMPMVEVFKTNVETGAQADGILEKLSACFPHCRINFDLDDRDRILRVETEEELEPEEIIRLLAGQGFVCGVLE
jgi:hypothetical protein